MSNVRNDELEHLARIFGALSNPHRLRIFLRLISCCEPGTVCSVEMPSEMPSTCCVGDLGQDMGIVLSTVSHHLKELHQAGLINMKRQGQRVECWVNPKTVRLVADFFSFAREGEVAREGEAQKGESR